MQAHHFSSFRFWPILNENGEKSEQVEFLDFIKFYHLDFLVNLYIDFIARPMKSLWGVWHQKTLLAS